MTGAFLLKQLGFTVENKTYIRSRALQVPQLPFKPSTFFFFLQATAIIYADIFIMSMLSDPVMSVWLLDIKLNKKCMWVYRQVHESLWSQISDHHASANAKSQKNSI